MFKWASKQKDRNRQKHQRQTGSKQSSQPCSPAHSSTTFKSCASQSSYRKICLKKPSNNNSIKKNTLITENSTYKNSRQSYPHYPTNTKEFINTPTKQNKKTLISYDSKRGINNSIEDSEHFNKKQLSNFIEEKLNHRQNLYQKKNEGLIHTNRHANGHSRNQRCINSNKKIVIKLMAYNNLMLSEYLMHYYDVRQKVWNPYTFALIMLKMGFINDLVNDRYLVKRLWESLQHPDILGLYAFLEKVMDNRLDLSEAQKAINEATSNKISVSIASAQRIILDNENSHYISELKNRRINRKQGIHL